MLAGDQRTLPKYLVLALLATTFSTMFTNGANATPPSTPTATSISITSGVTGGGTVDTLTGTNLTSASSVTIAKIRLPI